MKKNVLDKMNLNSGKLTRLYRMLYQFGPANGKLLILPYDQGLEHGPRDFFDNPDSIDPDFIFNLGIEGGFSAIVMHIGIAEKYYHKYAGQIPLILKLNGKTDIPSDSQPVSPLVASVEDAVRIGADAVGYTLYVGSPLQTADFIAFHQIRQDATKYGMPLFVWSYPRGEAVDKKGGRDSFYAVDYSARAACELGADVVILNYPSNNPDDRHHARKPYQSIDWDPAKCLENAIKSASNTLVVVTGGGRIDDSALIIKAEKCLKAGATGLIIGRNIWQRPKEKALEIVRQIRQLMDKQMGDS